MAFKKNISSIFGIFGAIFAIAGLFTFITFRANVWLYTGLEILAVIQLSIFFLSSSSSLKDFSEQRSTKFGVNSALMIVIFIAILSIVNFILARHEVRVDLSDAGTFSLSQQTKQILKNLEHEVKITGFFREQSKVKKQAEDLLNNYTRLSDKLNYAIIDPDKKPVLARKYGITDYDKILVESEGRSAIARAVTEEGVTSALIQTSREKKKTLYFVEGHGEKRIDDTEREGYASLKEALKKQGFIVKKLVLLSKKSIPDDADVLIIGGPQRPFTKKEQNMIQQYLDRQGQMFIAIDPMVETGLESFLSAWGVVLKDDLILDPSSGLGPAIPTVNPDGYPEQAITKNFNLATFFPVSRSVSFDLSSADRIQFEPLLLSGSETWTTEETDGDLAVDPQKDRKGPIIFGGVFTSISANQPPKASESESPQAMRLVVVGDSDFGTNGVAQAAGNGDLFQNIIAWLADEGDLVSIRPREIPTTTLLLNDKQIGVIFTVSVLLLPLGIMGIGLVIWRKRRSL